MNFISYSYLLFLPLTVLFYYALPRSWRTYWLLAASWFFYSCWNFKYLALLITTTVTTYLSGLLIQKAKDSRSGEGHSGKEKAALAFACLINFGILFVFKYSGFFFRSVHPLIRLLSGREEAVLWNLILPVGISFYTFQAVSYTIDVFTGTTKAEKNFFRYALFVSFFPQLVAGPIERSNNLLAQLGGDRPFDHRKASEGLLQILWGFFMKMVIADRAAVFVNTVYNASGEYPGMYLIVATILFSVQIYCDFGGYSQIAIGSAKLLNIDLMENFNTPYLASGCADFWRRWHISLSSWFRDYVYIPLGGSRRGTGRTYLNIMIVFLLSGLWHGAAWSFVAWGLINGLYQVAGACLKPYREGIQDWFGLQRNSLAHRGAGILVTYCLITFAWIFFRANGLMHAFSVIRSIFTVRNPWILFDGSLAQCGLKMPQLILLVIAILILLAADLFKYSGICIRKVILKQDFWFRCLWIAAAVCVIAVFGVWGSGFSAADFIYFQF